ncbi:hypothetical protein [Chryseobacterium sp. Leaf180]|uniref:hypothetical protein n=1 Tax=Chryseobacterium sp. Leaf180 TaxID=1736289 RepID=UPI000A8341AC|nr:hypothetical protein [Chryseobacterium sp. Leaf180]
MKTENFEVTAKEKSTDFDGLKRGNKFISFLFGLSLLLNFYSCTMPRKAKNEVLNINGIFEAKCLNGSLRYNLVSLLNRKLIRDTLQGKPIDKYKIKLEMVDRWHVAISTIDEFDKILHKKTYKFKQKKNILILKNQNTKALLVPYLAGALDITKLKLNIDKSGNLNVLIYEHRSGGLFFIPMGWSTTSRSAEFRRAE